MAGVEDNELSVFDRISLAVALAGGGNVPHPLGVVDRVGLTVRTTWMNTHPSSSRAGLAHRRTPSSTSDMEQLAAPEGSRLQCRHFLAPFFVHIHEDVDFALFLLGEPEAKAFRAPRFQLCRILLKCATHGPSTSGQRARNRKIKKNNHTPGGLKIHQSTWPLIYGEGHEMKPAAAAIAIGLATLPLTRASFAQTADDHIFRPHQERIFSGGEE